MESCRHPGEPTTGPRSIAATSPSGSSSG